MITATPNEARRAVDLLAIQAALESLTVYDCTHSPERQVQYIEGRAIIHADNLAHAGLDPFEAAAVSEHLLEAASWCLSAKATEPDALLHEAVVKAAIIYEISHDARAAVQLPLHAALTVAQSVLDGQKLDDLTQRLQRAVEGVVAEPKGWA